MAPRAFSPYDPTDPENPAPCEIARGCKYVLFYGRKGVERPKIRRQMWIGAVLGYDERCETKAISTKLLNTTVARMLISKSDFMARRETFPTGVIQRITGEYRYPDSANAR